MGMSGTLKDIENEKDGTKPRDGAKVIIRFDARGIHQLPVFLQRRLLLLPAVDPAPMLDEAQMKRLAAGECLVLDRRPDETGEPDGRFVTTARFIEGKSRDDLGSHQ
jgi:hypothetical protein